MVSINLLNSQVEENTYPILLLRSITIFIVAIISEVIPRFSPAQNSCLGFVCFELFEQKSKVNTYELQKIRHFKTYLGHVREGVKFKLLDCSGRISSRIDRYLIVVVDKFIFAIIGNILIFIR